MKKIPKNYLTRLKRINSKKTSKLNEKQLNQLAKYVHDVITTGRTGSYRYLIYDVLKPPVAYADGMYLGLLEFNNMLGDLAGRYKND
jgi:hypothetical protein